MRKLFIFLSVTLPFCLSSQDSTALNMDAVYTRPFMTGEKAPVSLGGYIEANTNYSGSDGVTEGFSFQIPRMTIFMAGTINNRIKFLSEIELEEGGSEIAIEFAAIDVEFHPLLNFRGGVIMNPIGAFNQNHDGPKWEFINRPIASTTIVPATWSNVGMGIYGKTARNNLIFAYEAYLSNGFDNTIIENSENRTWLPSSKENKERFEESFNGSPLVTLKGAVKYLGIGEVGFSWMGGVYNKYEEDGIQLDKKRRLDVLAIDYNFGLPSDTRFVGEYVWALINVPSTYSQQFGRRQNGGFLDIVQPIFKKEIMGWKDARILISTRLEYVDYNNGRFRETGDNIFDHSYAFVPSISLRPSSETVFRFNYRMDWERDILGNPLTKSVSYQFGFSTYF